MMAYFSNGTEGMDYQDRYCEKCANADEDGMCPIWDAHLVFSYGAKGGVKGILDMLIPTGGDGFPTQCSMFKEAK